MLSAHTQRNMASFAEAPAGDVAKGTSRHARTRGASTRALEGGRARPPARSPQLIPSVPILDVCFHRREDLQDQVRAVPRRRGRRRPQAGTSAATRAGTARMPTGDPPPRAIDPRSPAAKNLPGGSHASAVSRWRARCARVRARVRPTTDGVRVFSVLFGARRADRLVTETHDCDAYRAPTSAVCSAASPARRRVSRTPPRTRTRASSGARTRSTTTCSTRRSTSRARRWSSPGLKSRRTAPTSSPTSRKAPSESLSSLRTEHEVALAYLLAWLIACKGTRARGRAFGRGPFISSQC